MEKDAHGIAKRLWLAELDMLVFESRKRKTIRQNKFGIISIQVFVDERAPRSETWGKTMFQEVGKRNCEVEEFRKKSRKTSGKWYLQIQVKSELPGRSVKKCV